MTDPQTPQAPADTPPGEPQREAEQTIRSIRRLEESNDPPGPGEGALDG